MVDLPARLVAHTPSEPGGDWHYLDEHSSEVADETMRSAARFGVAEIGFWLGLLHDLGKALEGFQRYLWRCFVASRDETKPPQSDTPHAAPGAVFAEDILLRSNADGSLRKLMTLAIHAHHSYLREPGTSRNELKGLRFQQHLPNEQMWNGFRQLCLGLKTKPPKLIMPIVSNPQLEFLIRMLLSTLVDADRRSTERHDNPARLPCGSGLWRLVT